ncbi:hypothetical protein V5O48_004414 [Marasmius crinis-equi]|uniref:DUF8191 domain-containing protein n=1 Tax=Marasmius crinis-equi TaxID=585013 RepID=A0ABR3FQN9_9AGAR
MTSDSLLQRRPRRLTLASDDDMEREKLLLRGIILAQRKTIENLQRDSHQLRSALRVFTDDAGSKPSAEDSIFEDAMNDDENLDGLLDSLAFSDVEDLNATPSEVSANSKVVLEAVREVEVNYEIHEKVEEGDDEKEPIPLWDAQEDVYRCPFCGWEIVERECQGCGEEYTNYVCEETPDGYEVDESDETFHLHNEDHLLPTQRSTTPLLEVDPARLHRDTVAYGYEERLDEYKALLQRGGTRLMCETFSLEYSDDLGIFIEMADNEELFDVWAGADIIGSECGSWRVFLGREIHLSADDLDGSAYIEDFLEEALVYGTQEPSEEGEVFWVTTQVYPGHWETKGILWKEKAGKGPEGIVALNEEPSETQVTDPTESSGAVGIEGVTPAKGAAVDDADGDDGYESLLDEDELNSPFSIAKNEYESDGIDDGSIGADSDEEEGFESEKEDKFWGPGQERYQYNSEGSVAEEYESDHSSLW